jgi:hypothetical protein
MNIDRYSEEWKRKVSAGKTKHGQAGGRFGKRWSPTYCTWAGMLARCRRKTNKKYAGRGITVCERWLSFEHFFADMGERPVGMTIDRIDNGAGYFPGNCRWATPIQQARNRRNSHLLTALGKTMTLAEWEEETGINRMTIECRLLRGWDNDRAVSTPARKITYWTRQ